MIKSILKSLFITLIAIFISIIATVASHRFLSLDNELKIYSKTFWQHRLEPPVAASDMMVYVISLDRSPERYAATKVSLDAEGLKHTRSSAADGYLLQITDDAGITFTGADLKNGMHQFNMGHKYIVHCHSGNITYAPNEGFKHLLTAGELGCLCSHHDIWQNIVASGYKNTLVLEDDIALTKGFIPAFSQLLRKLPWRYDLLYVIYGADSPKVARIINNSDVMKILSNKSLLWYTAAYLISENGAKELLNIQTVDRPVDHVMNNAIISEKVRAYAVAKQKYILLQEDAIPSAITNMGRKPHT